LKSLIWKRFGPNSQCFYWLFAMNGAETGE